MTPLPTSNLLLKQQPKLFERILSKQFKPLAVLELLGLSIVGLAIFGAVMSIPFPHWWHTGNLMWKMLALIFGSYALCTPALYVFSSIRGSRLTLMQLVSFLLASIATTAIVLLALSPIAWFFTWSTNGDIEVLRVMNGLMIGFGIIFGIILLMRAFHAGYKHYKEQHPDNKSAADILLLWLILVIVVTAQMSMKLGPWYNPESKVCVGSDICFPRAATGEFVTEPTIEVSTVGEPTKVVWSIPETDCEGTNEAEYIDDEAIARQYINGSTADCSLVDGAWSCSALLTEIDASQNSREFTVQTHNECNGHSYISPTIQYLR